MIRRAVRAEFRKIASTRSWWIIAAVLVVYIAALASGTVIVTLGVADYDPSIATLLAPLTYGMPSSVGYVFPLLFGSMLVTSEYRHDTLTPTFLAIPSRGAVLTAKFFTGTAMGVLHGLVGVTVAVVVGSSAIALYGADPLLGASETWALLGRVVLAMGLWGAVGVSLGVLIPNQAVAVVLVLVLTQFIEPGLRLAATLVDGLGEVVRYLPGAASDSLTGSSVYSALQLGAATEPITWWIGGSLLFTYAVTLAVVGAGTVWRRDIT